jgi:sulfatase maturation enzyme AslB (radical SAM superfamily)
MTPKEVLTNSVFCPIPWTGLMYNFDGQIKNCIRSTEPIGNIRDNTIEEIVRGQANTARQLAILDQTYTKNCSPCHDLEIGKKNFDIISDRIFYIRELKNVPMHTYRAHNFDLQTIDVRWTNLCNQACVYCTAEFSSKWAKEVNIYLPTPTESQRTEFKEYIFRHARQLKHVYMAGGEPLLMKENLELLELLDPDVNLRINTNLSKVDTKIFERVCEFRNVHWTVSVESMEQEYEYIRYGGSWDNFLENLAHIKSLNHKISFNMLYFLLNYNSLFECIDFLKGMGFQNNSFVVGALLTPEYLNIRNLPNDVLKSLKQTLTDRINQHPRFLLENGYVNLLNYIMTPYRADLDDSFKKLAEIDRRRKIDSSKIFKDLYKLKGN